MGATDARAVDLVVIGAGTAGIVAARTAVRLGARVVLITADAPGGDCLFTGCVPSKALIAAASASHSSRTSAGLGVFSQVRVDFTAVMRHVHEAISAIAPSDSVETLEAGGIEVLHGVARFTGASSLEFSGRTIAFQRAIICTGAAPEQFAGALTSDTFWSLTTLPDRLLVIGGGPVGCEIAGAMARLGSAVTLVQRGQRLLPAEDPRASDTITKSLEADGVRVLLDAEVVSIAAHDGGSTGRSAAGRMVGATCGSAAVIPCGSAAVLACGAPAESIHFDAALAAIGRTPRTAGLELVLAGVETDAAGAVVTDEQLRTTNPRVWAAGDVTALPRFTHTASANAEVAVINALSSAGTAVDAVVARVTYTSPEVASVGEPTVLTGASGASASEIRRVLTFDHANLDRAIVDGQTAGFTSIIVDDSGVILGATIVGPRAGETLGELALAVRLGLTTHQLAMTTHAYPGYGYAVRKLALQDVRARISATGDHPLHP